MKSKKSIEFDMLKVFKRDSRIDEIEKYGKPINFGNVYSSKKKYSRNTKHKHKHNY